jgi:hypothetical protein
MIAARVGKLVCEVERKITRREYFEWNAFFQMEYEAKKKAIDEAKKK